MFARVTIWEARPERLDNMIHEIEEHALPALRRQDGFAGVQLLGERGSGKVLAVTLWESKQAMDDTEETADWLRGFGAGSASGMVKTVERYEVFFSEVIGARP